MCALSGTLATMCPAVPYALAAKFAYPDRPVIAAIGDGALQMLGINALIDVAQATATAGATSSSWSACCTTTISTR